MMLRLFTAVLCCSERRGDGANKVRGNGRSVGCYAVPKKQQFLESTTVYRVGGEKSHGQVWTGRPLVRHNVGRARFGMSYLGGGDSCDEAAKFAAT